MMAIAAGGGASSRQIERREGLQYARAWRERWGPVFDELYPESVPVAGRCLSCGRQLWRGEVSR